MKGYVGKVEYAGQPCDGEGRSGGLAFGVGFEPTDGDCTKAKLCD
jgi:hypothetical protein